MVFLEAPKNAQFHVMYIVPQQSLSFIIFQTMFQCNCVMKWNYSVWIHRKLNALCILATRKMFGCNHRKGNVLLQLQWEGLGLMYETKNFLSTLSWIPSFHFSFPLVNRVKNWRSSKKCEYYKQMFYDTRGNWSMTSVIRRNDFLMWAEAAHTKDARITCLK
jgi:hypothetical protein